MESFAMRSPESDGGSAGSPSGREGAVRDLARSIELAERLQIILADYSAGHPAASVASNLAGEFLALVSGTLPALTSPTEVGGRQLMREEEIDIRGAGGKIPIRRKGAGAAATKRRRAKETRMLMTSRPLDDDGFSWKKYGQKAIKGANYPRSYFKCSEWSLHGCPATKQVQQKDDDPNKFVVTYVHNHTCQLLLDIDESTERFTINYEPGRRGGQSTPLLHQSSSSVVVNKCFVSTVLPLDQIDVSSSDASHSTCTTTEIRHSDLEHVPAVSSNLMTASTGSCDDIVTNFHSPSPISSDFSSIKDNTESIGNFFWDLDEEYLLS